MHHLSFLLLPDTYAYPPGIRPSFKIILIRPGGSSRLVKELATPLLQNHRSSSSSHPSILRQFLFFGFFFVWMHQDQAHSGSSTRDESSRLCTLPREHQRPESSAGDSIRETPAFIFTFCWTSRKRLDPLDSVPSSNAIYGIISTYPVSWFEIDPRDSGMTQRSNEVDDQCKRHVEDWRLHLLIHRRELMKLMTEVYCPMNEIQKMETEPWNLTVKNYDLTAYTQRFQEFTMTYTKMVPEEEDRVEKFN
ncbi:hypothetical protein Tco_0345853 [Tanacetum coccineum]